jgi:hypothetical protein
MTALTHEASGSSAATGIWDQILSQAQEPKSHQVSWYQSSGLLNDRRAHRVAFPETLHVVGLEINSDNGQFVAVTDVIIAGGRDISVDGISFQHKDPVPHRFVSVSFRSSLGTETLVAKLSWCRFSREGHYVSGGRLIVEPQRNLELSIDWDSGSVAVTGPDRRAEPRRA